MKIILYTINGSRGNELKEKLDEKHIEYETVEDISVMREKGFKSAPMLEVDGEIFNFVNACKWVAKQ